MNASPDRAPTRRKAGRLKGALRLAFDDVPEDIGEALPGILEGAYQKPIGADGHDGTFSSFRRKDRTAGAARREL